VADSAIREVGHRMAMELVANRTDLSDTQAVIMRLAHSFATHHAIYTFIGKHYDEIVEEARRLLEVEADRLVAEELNG
jgi:hypothetical protein